MPIDDIDPEACDLCGSIHLASVDCDALDDEDWDEEEDSLDWEEGDLDEDEFDEDDEI